MMHHETMNEIHRAAKERLNLYLTAAHQGLKPAELQRLQELDALLPVLWDRYRREYAGRGSEHGRTQRMPRAA